MIQVSIFEIFNLYCIGLSLRNIEDLLICKEKSQNMLKKNNEALLQYVEDIKALRSIVLNEIG